MTESIGLSSPDLTNAVENSPWLVALLAVLWFNYKEKIELIKQNKKEEEK